NSSPVWGGSGSRTSCACKICRAVLVGYVRFPLTLALSLREREHRIPRCNESRRSALARARRVILPLPKGEGQGEGELTLETPTRMRPARPVRFATQRRAILPKGDGGRAQRRGEGEATLETPIRLR